MHLIVSSLNSRTLCLEFLNSNVSVQDIKSRIQDVEGIPISQQRLVLNQKELQDSQIFATEDVDQLPPFRLLLPLVGGKGGFGSLLRGGNQGVTAVKTTNFNACRDLSGRRIRHVKNEQLLRQWYSTEKEREEKAKVVKQPKKGISPVQESQILSKWEDDTSKLTQGLQTAVLVGIRSSEAKRKRELENGKNGKNDQDEDDDEEDEDDDEDDEDDDEEDEDDEEDDEDDEENDEDEEADADDESKKNESGKSETTTTTTTSYEEPPSKRLKMD